MQGIHIVCGSCRHHWHIDVQDSTYYALNLMSQPCPHCEAYTLSCHNGREALAETALVPPHRPDGN